MGIITEGAKIINVSDNGYLHDLFKTMGTGPQPTQLVVDPTVIDSYSQKLRSSEKVPPIDVIRLPDGREFITEGHHRFLASQLTGIPVEKKVFPNRGPVGFNWANVKLGRLDNE